MVIPSNPQDAAIYLAVHKGLNGDASQSDESLEPRTQATEILD